MVHPDGLSDPVHRGALVHGVLLHPLVEPLERPPHPVFDLEPVPVHLLEPLQHGLEPPTPPAPGVCEVDDGHHWWFLHGLSPRHAGAPRHIDPPGKRVAVVPTYLGNAAFASAWDSPTPSSARGAKEPPRPTTLQSMAGRTKCVSRTWIWPGHAQRRAGSKASRGRTSRGPSAWTSRRRNPSCAP